jgi:hypothetical protein
MRDCFKLKTPEEVKEFLESTSMREVGINLGCLVLERRNG